MTDTTLEVQEETAAPSVAAVKALTRCDVCDRFTAPNEFAALVGLPLMCWACFYDGMACAIDTSANQQTRWGSLWGAPGGNAPFQVNVERSTQTRDGRDKLRHLRPRGWCSPMVQRLQEAAHPVREAQAARDAVVREHGLRVDALEERRQTLERRRAALAAQRRKAKDIQSQAKSTESSLSAEDEALEALAGELEKEARELAS